MPYFLATLSISPGFSRDVVSSWQFNGKCRGGRAERLDLGTTRKALQFTLPVPHHTFFPFAALDAAAGAPRAGECRSMEVQADSTVVLYGDIMGNTHWVRCLYSFTAPHGMQASVYFATAELGRVSEYPAWTCGGRFQ